VHGRTLAIAAAAAIALFAVPAAATADPMPAGTYDLSTNGGSIQVGSFLPAIPLPNAGPIPVPISGQPINVSLPGIATIPGTINTTIPLGTLTGNYTVNVPSANLAVDPSTGSATLDVSFYVSFSLQAATVVTVNTTCTVGDAAHPIVLHLTTANGSPWSATTGNYGLADRTFTVPSPSCDNGSVASILGLLIGGGSSGSNAAQVTGNASRRPDAPATTGGGGTGTTAGTVPTEPTTPGTTAGTPGTNGAKAPACVVPKLKNKSLKAVKRALKKAHCRLGKVTKAKPKHGKRGTVTNQKFKAGRRLPANSRVPITIVS
jgi:hypothetical protein